ncbi:MAG: hypothetical protein ABW136_08530, partial [Steroidobacteraceae bacterium]
AAPAVASSAPARRKRDLIMHSLLNVVVNVLRDNIAITMPVTSDRAGAEPNLLPPAKTTITADFLLSDQPSVLQSIYRSRPEVYLRSNHS